MNVNVVCVGKLKEQFWRDACAEYLKRLGGFGKAAVVELPESKLSQEPSEAEIRAALNAEGRLMQPYLSDKKALQIALCVEGRQLSSEELSEKLESAGVSGLGSCGLRLSISKMTLPHQLCRVVLLEQVYRAFSISAGSKYHK